MAEAQRGDAGAYGALLDDIGPVLMSFLRRRVRDAEEVQDVYQDIFMAVHRARHTYQPTRPLEPWLFAIARRVMTDHQRRRLSRHAREALVDTLPEVSVESDAHLKPQLEQAIRGLSPDQRRALELLRLEGLPVEAAARRAGTSVGALKVRAHRAYKMIRQLL
jgi:RNA polymerase sigma-70 factor (ECF subfamily)